MIRVPTENVYAHMLQAFVAMGVSEQDARMEADSLIAADCWGVTTHGVAMFPNYVLNLEKGLYNAKPNLKIERRYGATLSVDGDNGLGAVTMTKALNAAMELAEQTGIAAAGVRGCNHAGACGYYSELAARKGFVSMVLAEAMPIMAPFGSREPYFGTNPIAIGMPRSEEHDQVVADMATTVVARGKILNAMRKGEAIPEGWALDSEGRPTTDPAEANKGVMLPIAGHKGSALAMAVSFLCGVMTGAAYGYDMHSMFELEREEIANVGQFLFVMKKDAFVDAQRYEERMDHFCGTIKGLKPAAGFSEVLLPGEPERRSYQRRYDEGIAFDDKLIEQMRKAASLCGIDPLM